MIYGFTIDRNIYFLSKDLQYRYYIGQGGWVSEVLGLKRNGHFLEFGALDGGFASNCYSCEKELS